MPPRAKGGGGGGGAAAAAAAPALDASAPLEVLCPSLGAWFDCEVVRPAGVGRHELSLCEPTHCAAAGASWSDGGGDGAKHVAAAKLLRRRSEAMQDADCGAVAAGMRALCLLRRGGGVAPLWVDATVVRAARFPHRFGGECQVRARKLRVRLLTHTCAHLLLPVCLPAAPDVHCPQ
jgi:hypothetical protein